MVAIDSVGLLTVVEAALDGVEEAGLITEEEDSMVIGVDVLEAAHPEIGTETETGTETGTGAVVGAGAGLEEAVVLDVDRYLLKVYNIDNLYIDNRSLTIAN